jgi:uncharacterized protein
MKRRTFIQYAGLTTGGVLLSRFSGGVPTAEYPAVRVPPSKRMFTSAAVEKSIRVFKTSVKDKELGWLFENCFPNTLDTTVTFFHEEWSPRHLRDNG